VGAPKPQERSADARARISNRAIPPEQPLRALLLQAFFTVRSERQLMAQLIYNIMFRWFVGLSMDAPVWDVTVFTENRDRLLEGDIARGFLLALLAHAQIAPLLSDDHVSVDGTLIEAWGSMKSLRPKDGSGEPPGVRTAVSVDLRLWRRRNADSRQKFTRLRDFSAACQAGAYRQPKPPRRMAVPLE
jgi:transposase